LNSGKFTLNDVLFGINFHWERKEDRTLQAFCRMTARSNGTHAVITKFLWNSILQCYLPKWANAPIEFLKDRQSPPRSCCGRCWNEKKQSTLACRRSTHSNRWRTYSVVMTGRSDLFDVRRRHCQRLYGISKNYFRGSAKSCYDTRVFSVAWRWILRRPFSQSVRRIDPKIGECMADTPILIFHYLLFAEERARIITEKDAEVDLSFPKAYCRHYRWISETDSSGVESRNSRFFRWEGAFNTRTLPNWYAKIRDWFWGN